MRASIQEQISPLAAQASSLDFSAAQVKMEDKAIDSSSVNRASFKDLILDSEAEIQRERVAKKNNDLSDAKTEKEFLQRLQEMSKPKAEAKNTLDKDDFLKLLVAQLQHQDPLNPDDGAEMASKLAQFNGVEQMMNVNKTLEKMAEGQKSDRSTQFINYINKEVTTEGGQFRIDGGKFAGKSTYKLPVDASTSSLEVRDTMGKVVFQKDLGSVKAGTHAMNWDGKNEKGEFIGDGSYTYAIIAKNMDGQDIPVTITNKTKIMGIDFKDPDGAFYTDTGKMKFNEIVSIGNPGYDRETLAALASSAPSRTGEKTAAAEKNATPANAPKPAGSTEEELKKMDVAGKLIEPKIEKEAPKAEEPPKVDVEIEQPKP